VKIEITALLITHNEARNIEKTLNKLRWVSRIVVIDSGSTDETRDIVRSYPRAELLYHRFVDFASQCNFGLAQVTGEWVLSLDADYELSDELVKELRGLEPPDDTAGYRAGFIFRVHGRALRGTLYPPRTVLYRREGALYRREGHAHRVIVSGKVLPLRGVIYHEDRKPLARWLASQQRYARDEAEWLLSRRGTKDIGWTDRLRLRCWPAPFAVLLYTLFVKGCLFDGWPGWFYALQRLFAETLLALEILDRRLRGDVRLKCGAAKTARQDTPR
jgi:glycosyltransferase involved in cell wall biosynthesis